MSSVIRNSWPQDIATDDVVSPEMILQHQADQLSSVTKGLLIGHVAKTTADDRIVLSLEAEAPALKFTVKLFECLHQLDFDYPATIVPPDPLPDFLLRRTFEPATPAKSLTQMELMMRPGRIEIPARPARWVDNPWVASDPKEFADKVESVIRSPEAKSILLSLIARAQKHLSQASETRPS